MKTTPFARKVSRASLLLIFGLASLVACQKNEQGSGGSASESEASKSFLKETDLTCYQGRRGDTMAILCVEPLDVARLVSPDMGDYNEQQYQISGLNTCELYEREAGAADGWMEGSHRRLSGIGWATIYASDEVQNKQTTFNFGYQSNNSASSHSKEKGFQKNEAFSSTRGGGLIIKKEGGNLNAICFARKADQSEFLPTWSLPLQKVTYAEAINFVSQLLSDAKKVNRPAAVSAESLLLGFQKALEATAKSFNETLTYQRQRKERKDLRARLEAEEQERIRARAAEQERWRQLDADRRAQAEADARARREEEDRRARERAAALEQEQKNMETTRREFRELAAKFKKDFGVDVSADFSVTQFGLQKASVILKNLRESIGTNKEGIYVQAIQFVDSGASLDEWRHRVSLTVQVNVGVDGNGTSALVWEESELMKNLMEQDGQFEEHRKRLKLLSSLSEVAKMEKPKPGSLSQRRLSYSQKYLVSLNEAFLRLETGSLASALNLINAELARVSEVKTLQQVRSLLDSVQSQRSTDLLVNNASALMLLSYVASDFLTNTGSSCTSIGFSVENKKSDAEMAKEYGLVVDSYLKLFTLAEKLGKNLSCPALTRLVFETDAREGSIQGFNARLPVQNADALEKVLRDLGLVKKSESSKKSDKTPKK